MDVPGLAVLTLGATLVCGCFQTMTAEHWVLPSLNAHT